MPKLTAEDQALLTSEEIMKRKLAMNPVIKGLLYFDAFGYDPTFKFAPYRSQFGSVMTLVSLFFFVVYVIGTLLYFLLGTPVPTNEYNSISSISSFVELPQVGIIVQGGGDFKVYFEQMFQQKRLEDGKVLEGKAKNMRVKTVQMGDEDEFGVPNVTAQSPQVTGRLQGSAIDEYYQTVRAQVLTCLKHDASPDCLSDRAAKVAAADNKASIQLLVKRPSHKKYPEPMLFFDRPINIDPSCREEDTCIKQTTRDACKAHRPISKLCPAPCRPSANCPIIAGTATTEHTKGCLLPDGGCKTATTNPDPCPSIHLSSDPDPCVWDDALGKCHFPCPDAARQIVVLYRMMQVFVSHRFLPIGYNYTYAYFHGIQEQIDPVKVSEDAHPFPYSNNADGISGSGKIADFLFALDATAVKQAWTYDSLLVMLSKWGGIAAFCMLIFGGSATYWNYFFFFRQLEGRDINQMTREDFDSHGRILLQPLKMPQEFISFAENNWAITGRVKREKARRAADTLADKLADKLGRGEQLTPDDIDDMVFYLLEPVINELEDGSAAIPKEIPDQEALIDRYIKTRDIRTLQKIKGKPTPEGKPGAVGPTVDEWKQHMQLALQEERDARALEESEGDQEGDGIVINV